jgi:hypothetical protein
MGARSAEVHGTVFLVVIILLGALGSRVEVFFDGFVLRGLVTRIRRGVSIRLVVVDQNVRSEL